MDSTIGARFRADYHQEAFDRECAAIESDGFDAGTLTWMRDDAERSAALDERCSWLVHHSLLAGTNDDQAWRARRDFLDGLKAWVNRYLDSWTDAAMAEFMRQSDQRQAEQLADERASRRAAERRGEAWCDQ